MLSCYLHLLPCTLLFRNTYCGLATMALITEVDRLNLDSLMVTYTICFEMINEITLLFLTN